MPAQLILIANHREGGNAEQKDEEKKGSETSSGAEGSGKPRRFPKHRKIPIGVLNVVGQDPEDIGSFADLDELLEAARSYEVSPHRSNTVFGSVRSVAGSDDESGLHSLQGRLDQLPDQLTIIVQEEKRRG